MTSECIKLLASLEAEITSLEATQQEIIDKRDTVSIFKDPKTYEALTIDIEEIEVKIDDVKQTLADTRVDCVDKVIAPAGITREIQYQADNNNIISDGYVKGTITYDECDDSSDSYYVMTIPKGVILKDFIIYGTSNVDSFSGTVEVGVNDCTVCDFKFEAKPNTVICETDACRCGVMMLEDKLVKVELNSGVPEGTITFLAHVVNPNHVICRANPVALKINKTLVDDCTDCGVACEPCGNGVIVNTTTTTTTEIPK